MTDNVYVTHTKTDTIPDWTQADVDAQIAAGNLPPGTLLADVVLPSDWNANHTLAGMTQLLSSIRDYAVINMGGGDYTMTDAEAVKFLKVIVNEGTGSTLYWPTTSDAYTAIDQQVSMQFTTKDVILASQTGGVAVTLKAGLRGSSAITYLPGVAVTAKNYLDAAYYRQGTNGVNVQSANYTAVANDSGKLIVFDAFSGTLTISAAATTDYGDNAVIHATALGIPDTFIISAGAGVTINGATKGYANSVVTIQRDGSTDTWYCTSSLDEVLKVTATVSPTTCYPLLVTAAGTVPVLSDVTNISYVPSTGTLTTKIVKVDDDVYGAGWNGSLEVPTKNAVYDKIQTMGGNGTITALDFGANSTNVSASVVDATVTANDYVACHIVAGSTMTAEDAAIQGVMATSVVNAGVGYTIYAAAPYGASGSINVLSNLVRI